MITLQGDTTPQDWYDVLGMFYAEYVHPVQAEKERRNLVWGQRPDLYRDRFNALIAECGENEHTLVEFYSSDWFSRVEASDLPEKNLLAYLLQKGAEPNAATPQALLALPECAHLRNRPITLLDHGCGDGHAGLGFAHATEGNSVYLYAVANPVRQVIAQALHKYASGADVRWRTFEHEYGAHFWERTSVTFDFIYSTDVMEHILNPIQEVVSLTRALKVGGVAYIATYFNSDKGRDPAHLQRHDHYSYEPHMWIKHVEAQGLRLLCETARGKTLFIKE